MPSPDLTAYIDLRPLDRDAATLVALAITRALVNAPDWTPREANTEVVVFEGVAAQVMEDVYAINRLPGAIMQALLRLFDIDLDPGTPPTADITFTVVDDAGYVIPAGTVVRLDIGGEYGSVLFSTDEELAIDPGDTVGTVAATGDRNVDVANGTAAGTALAIISSVYAAEAAELDTAVADGSNPEDDSAWLNRGAQRFARLTDVLVLPDHFKTRALEEADVDRAQALNDYDGVGANTSTDYGHITVAVLGDAGALLSGGRKTAIEDLLDDAAIAILDVHVIDPTITNVTVATTVLRLAGYTDAEVQANVIAALDAYLDPATWEWAGTVYLNELIPIIDAAAGVDRVTALTIGGVAANFALTGVAPLANYNAGASVITVTAP